MHNPLDIGGQERQRAINGAHASIAARQRRSDLLEQLGSLRGRRILWELLGGDECFTTSFASDALLMAWREGRRHRACQLFNELLAVDAELVALMQKENRQ